MNELSKRSARLLMDLQATQTNGSAQRGVGRFSQALIDNISINRGERDIFCLISDALPFKANLEAVPETRILRLPELPDWGSDESYHGGEKDYLDALAYSAFGAPIKADIIHLSHVFEGFGERVALPSPALRCSGQIYSATLYDLIPLLFQEPYLQNAEFRKWYFSRVAWLRQADLLLSISDSSRQDAIDLLGIEPWRIVTIHGGVSSHFKPGDNLAEERGRLIRRYGLRERFVLYAGGDDHRKNINGAIAGFAEIPRDLRKNHQLVIVCSMEEHRRQMYRDFSRSVGLSIEDIQFTGFVTEDDLIGFYRICDVFLFPSLYEGLGLPILEAMACGAPVIGGKNSSIREIIIREDALFDARSPKSIAASIAKVLRDKEFASELRSYGLKRVQYFSWQRTSRLAIEAFDEALERARAAGVKAALQGWVARKRIAVLTPLPPCRSGIADYNARFLPFLAKHLDIDVYVNSYVVSDESVAVPFRIFDIKDFEAAARSYDAILYEIGNSEFHEHMLPLLEKFPGIVGLHDAYLSGLMMYLEYYKGEQGRYSKEVLQAHGPLANRYLAPVQQCPDAVGKTITELPCTKRILDQAIGVISHSPFNLEIARKFYPEGWEAPYRIIPQMVSLPREWSAVQREETRNRLGFARDDFIIASFGHITWTKWGERVLEAFLSSRLRRVASAHLIYVGELPQDEFGRKLKETISSAGLGRQVQITGFLKSEDYEQYLRIADVAVQLRTNSRGGTPKSVLDCLAIGLPVIVNNDASFTDYPDDVAIKIDADPSSHLIAVELEKLFDDRDMRVAFSDAGKKYVRKNHDAAQCAAEYAAAIHEFIEREQLTRLPKVLSAFAPHLAGCANPSSSSNVALNWLSQIRTPMFAKRRLIIDVSHIAQYDHESGIQRVVKRVVKSMYCSSRTGFEPFAVELIDGVLRVASTWLSGKGLSVAEDIQRQGVSAEIVFRQGDVLLMLDSSWGRFREFFPVFERARAAGVPIYTAVYDLLPLTLPPGNFVEGGPEWFSSWLRDAISASDGIVCISKATADDVTAYMSALPELTSIPKIGYWHLGADFSHGHMESCPSVQTAKVASLPYLVMIGTIEPRKNHALALSAMEKLWEGEHELGLCIAGKEGWMVGDLMERLRTHPLLGKRLFLIEGPNDSDIDFLYKNAVGLLFLSKGEGFGLPLVEAAHYGIPVVCSDIPVLREIAGDFATYVPLSDAASIAIDLGKWWKKHGAGKLPNTRRMPRLSWAESAEALMDVVLNNNWLKGN